MKNIYIAIIFLLVASCGGGGGGSSSSSTSNTSSAASSSNADTSSSSSDATTSQNDTLVIDEELINIMGGKAVDGYIEGAKIFIDENFNLKLDDGEIWGVTDASGSFLMDVPVQRLLSMNLIELKSSGTTPIYEYKVDGTTSTQAQVEDFFACLKKRPLVAEVPVGAIDSTQGIVEQEYEMILPYIPRLWDEISGENASDPDYSSIIISPFSTLLSRALVSGIIDFKLEAQLSLSEGCGSQGRELAETVWAFVDHTLQKIEKNFGIDYREFLRDFVAQSTNDIITEENAALIASWLPLITTLRKEIGNQTKEVTGEYIVPLISMEDEVADEFLANEDVEEIDINLTFNYQTEPNSLGWYMVQSVDSVGSKLIKTQLDGTTKTGYLKPFKCADGSRSCLIVKLDLDGVMNSAEEHYEGFRFLNESGVEGHEGKRIVISKQKGSIYRDDLGKTYSNLYGEGQAGANYEDLNRKCINETFIGAEDLDNERRWNDINNSWRIVSGYQGIANILDCNQHVGQSRIGLNYDHEAVNNNSSNIREMFSIRMNDSGNDLDILSNHIKDPYAERDTLDVKPLLDEIDSFPWTFRELGEMRTKLSTSSYSNDIFYQLHGRGADGQYVGNTHDFHLYKQESDDTYQEWTDAREKVGQELKGQDARNAFFNALKATTYFSFDDIAGTAAP